MSSELACAFHQLLKTKLKTYIQGLYLEFRLYVLVSFVIHVMQLLGIIGSLALKLNTTRLQTHTKIDMAFLVKKNL